MSWHPPMACGRRDDRAPALAAVAAAAAAAPGCGETATGPTAGPGPATRPGSVLLITLDTTRADRLGAYGAGSAQTPSIDGLASRGLLFERAWSPAPLTLPSHASILTGLYPVEHGARDNTLYRVGDEIQLLSEALAARGWRTGAFVGSVVLARKYGLGQGFEIYRGVPGGAVEAGPAAVGARGDRPAEAVVDDALEWIGGLPRDAAWFAWVHLFDAHEPHQAPEPFASRPEDAEIAYATARSGACSTTGRVRPDERLLIAPPTTASLGQHEPPHSLVR
jgi:hypothetical protein